MSRRLTGAVLYAKVIHELRREFAEDYGLPMDLYAGKVYDVYDLGSDMQPILAVVFTHRKTGAELEITGIHPADDGTVMQRSADVGMRVPVTPPGNAQ